jgi:superfamily II RNA helicase
MARISTVRSRHRRGIFPWSFSAAAAALFLATLLVVPTNAFVHPSSRTAPFAFLHPPPITRLVAAAAAVNEDTESFASATSTVGTETAYSDAQQLIETGRLHFAHHFEVPLDDWQLQAGGAIYQGHNVIVCAPTGAGKTVVGEMALWHAFETDRDGIYTTPLKALSNQKYTELCQSFGRSNTGLSTGDISINKGARMTVMTTEVYRNIAWRSSTPDTLMDAIDVGERARGQDELINNAVVVLDEFHYMGHPGRGGVWEESVITSPVHSQIIGLSATLSNSQALSDWMESVTGRRTVLVEVPNQERPVPLRYMFATKEGLYPLFRDPDAGPGAPKGLLGLRGDGGMMLSNDDDSSKGKKKGFGRDEPDTEQKMPKGLQVNPALKSASEKRMQRVNRSIERQKLQHRGRMDDDFGDWDKSRSRRSKSRGSSGRLSPRNEQKERERLLKNEMRRSVPSLPALLNRLRQRDLLPAIFFIFSRVGCDQAARTVHDFMKGSRDRLQDDSPRGEQVDATQKRRKSRQRATRRPQKSDGDLIEDADGRSFRPSSNYLSEDTLASLLGSPELLDADTFDKSSPLSSGNWDYYAKTGLLNNEEVRQVASRISRFNDANEEIAFDDDIIEQYLFGVGSHHAGMLPAHKSFVEILFRNQFMKVVFATETLAAGINMPARTTVVCAMAKRGDSSSMNLLETSNLQQMAGRAGRRGMDTDGTCVIVATPFESHDDAAKILTDPLKPISSQFSPSYSLAVNLVARGVGKLDVARQLISKSFAMWEKRQVEENISDAVENHEGVSEILLASARERFVDVLGDALQVQVDRKRAKFDIGKVQALIDILNDRDSLKKSSKSYVGASKMLELEHTTLAYLKTEYATLHAALAEESDLLRDIAADDEKDLLNQIETQQLRTVTTEKEVSKHPFTTIAKLANEIMQEESPEAKVVNDALRSARETEDHISSLDLTAEELSTFAKAAVVVRRQTRKLANANPGLDPEALLKQVDSAEVVKDDSWDDMLAITKVLVAYGCLSMEAPLADDTPLEDQTYTITPAGVNIGMLGFENSLWCLVAMGGAWDVVGASAKLDKFRDAMNSFESDEMDWYNKEDDDTVDKEESDISKPQAEAESLVSLLRSMSPSELAGYVASLIADNSRGSQTSVVDLFQQLSPVQQRVTQSSLFVMERLTEVQKQFNVDESTRNCIL